MQSDLSATVRIEISADISTVWDALINPAYIQQYFFGTNAVSDWKVGSSLTFSGVWEGKEYQDKGTILQLQAPELLCYTYWSSFSGTDDIPENYATITYRVSATTDATLLTITQENIKSEKAKTHSEQNWRMVMTNLKHLLEKQAKEAQTA